MVVEAHWASRAVDLVPECSMHLRGVVLSKAGKVEFRLMFARGCYFSREILALYHFEADCALMIYSHII
jgi:hypothetical protein